MSCAIDFGMSKCIWLTLCALLLLCSQPYTAPQISVDTEAYCSIGAPDPDSAVGESSSRTRQGDLDSAQLKLCLIRVDISNEMIQGGRSS